VLIVVFYILGSEDDELLDEDRDESFDEELAVSFNVVFEFSGD
jgi:hypothetical protein